MKNRIINLFDYMADRDYVADYGSPEDIYREAVKFFSDPEVIEKIRPESNQSYTEYINSKEFEAVVEDEFYKYTF